jgi:hypothetical protein
VERRPSVADRVRRSAKPPERGREDLVWPAPAHPTRSASPIPCRAGDRISPCRIPPSGMADSIRGGISHQTEIG